MSKCVRCKMDILDESVVCPLCHGVLIQDEKAEDRYPDIQPVMRKLRIVSRIAVFAAIIIECICVYVNFLIYSEVKWSMATAAILAYVCFTIIYSIRQNKSHQRKMIMQFIIGNILVVAADVSLGYTGWSLDIVVPVAILLMDVGIDCLMIFNRKNWQNYIMAQIWMLVISLGNMAAVWIIEKEVGLMEVVALIATLFCFAVSYVIGDKTAENELKRRFHI